MKLRPRNRFFVVTGNHDVDRDHLAYLMRDIDVRVQIVVDGVDRVSYTYSPHPVDLAPPQFADFLISLIPAKHRINLLGDLERDYWNRFLPRHGVKMARCLYVFHTIYAFLGFLVRPLGGIVGLAWIRKLIEILAHKMMK